VPRPLADRSYAVERAQQRVEGEGRVLRRVERRLVLRRQLQRLGERARQPLLLLGLRHLLLQLRRLREEHFGRGARRLQPCDGGAARLAQRVQLALRALQLRTQLTTRT